MGTFAAVYAVHDRAASSLADAVVGQFRTIRGPRVLRLGLLAEHEPMTGALQARLRQCHTAAGPVVPRLEFLPGSDLRDHLSWNTRSAVARARNRLTRAGASLELSWVSDAGEAHALLPQVLEVHRRRNRQVRGTAVLDDPREAEHFAGMIARYAAAGQLRLLTAHVDGELAAFAVCFVAGGTSWVYANLVAPEFTSFSVGTIANAEVERSCHADPQVTCVDWEAGAQRYKLSGGAVAMPTHQLVAWSSPALELTVRIRAPTGPA